jgi:hypothetical protein
VGGTSEEPLSSAVKAVVSPLAIEATAAKKIIAITNTRGLFMEILRPCYRSETQLCRRDSRLAFLADRAQRALEDYIKQYKFENHLGGSP